MRTELSPYFENQTTRDLALEVFGKLIKKDGLTITELKKQSLEHDLNHKLLPTNIRKFGLYNDC